MYFKSVITCIILYSKYLVFLQTSSKRAGDTVFSLQHLTLCLRELGEREGEEEEKSPEYKIVVNTFFSTILYPSQGLIFHTYLFNLHNF